MIHRSLTGFSNETWEIIKHYYSQSHRLMAKIIKIKMREVNGKARMSGKTETWSTLDFWIKWIVL